MQPNQNRGPGFDPIVESRAVPETHLLPKVQDTRSNTWLNPKMTEYLLGMFDHNLTEPKIMFITSISFNKKLGLRFA